LPGEISVVELKKNGRKKPDFVFFMTFSFHCFAQCDPFLISSSLFISVLSMNFSSVLSVTFYQFLSFVYLSLIYEL
jgi:hypothetical protein